MNYNLITPHEQSVPSVVSEQQWCQGRAVCLSKPSSLLGLLALDCPGHWCPLPLSLDLPPVTLGSCEHTVGAALPIVVASYTW